MKTKRLPNIHPGEILLHDFLEPMGITRYRLAKATGIPQAQVLRICAGTRAITVETAVRLGVFFGVDPRNWLNLQRAYDLEEFERTRGAKVRKTVEKWASKSIANDEQEIGFLFFDKTPDVVCVKSIGL